MYDSFNKLLDKFPYFLNKNPGSNFYKSEQVFNNEFVELYNTLFKVYISSKINKPLLVWKEQTVPYNYDMYFKVELPYLKTVTITKEYTVEVSEEITVVDDETGEETTENITRKEFVSDIIYTETFEYDDEISSFEYLHSDTSLNIIPDEQYLFNVTTYDEYSLSKGFPENEIILNDDYDHDKSLDEIGELYNIPRKTYHEVDSSDYADTEPPYNNRLSEDDYHYMNRILFYINHLQDTPLPVLEIWKIFGLDVDSIQFINRERYIARMIDIARHSVDGVYNRNWVPQKWEHKDQWCTGRDDNLFFFANVDNSTPIQLQLFRFDFNILNSLAREVYNVTDENIFDDASSIIDEVKTPFLIVPFVNGACVDTVLYSNQKWSMRPTVWNSDDLIKYEDGVWLLNTNLESTFDFVFKCFRSMDEVKNELNNNNGVFTEFKGDLISDTIRVQVRGCNSADWYVNQVTGDDNNTGTSKTDAFKTLDKALSVVEGEKNIIALSDGKHRLNNPTQITKNTNIISCPDTHPLVYGQDLLFFKVMQDTRLYIQNVGLRYNCCIDFINDSNFINNNLTDNPLNVRISGGYCLTKTVIDLNLPDTMYYNTDYNVTGVLKTSTGETISNQDINVIIDDEKLNLMTDDDGLFTFKIPTDIVGEHNLSIVFEDNKPYCESCIDTSFEILKRPVIILAEVKETLPVKPYLIDDYHIDYDYDKYLMLDSYSILDVLGETPQGIVELMENDEVIVICRAEHNVNYAPPLGYHDYSLRFTPEYGYESTILELPRINIVKQDTMIVLSGDNAQYPEGENLLVNGVITTSDGENIADLYKTITVSEENNLLTGKQIHFNDDGEFTINYQELSIGSYNLLISYAGDSDYNPVSVNIVFNVVDAQILVYDDSSEDHKEVTIIDTLPADLTGYAADDMVLVVDGSGDNEMIITDNPDYDTSSLGDDDIVLVDCDDDTELDVLILDKETEED